MKHSTIVNPEFFNLKGELLEQVARFNAFISQRDFVEIKDSGLMPLCGEENGELFLYVHFSQIFDFQKSLPNGAPEEGFPAMLQQGFLKVDLFPVCEFFDWPINAIARHYTDNEDTIEL